jgi:hypothetical protein
MVKENEEVAFSSQLEHLVPSRPWSGLFGMLMPHRLHFFSIAKRTWHDRNEAKAVQRSEVRGGGELKVIC